MVDPMICPNCGAQMNHHAEKLLHPTGPADAPSLDTVLGGIVVEMHTCPQCGTGASRSAPSTPHGAAGPRR